MYDFNFTKFPSDRVMGGASFCCASYCCFREFAFWKFTFAKLLLLLTAAYPEGASYCCLLTNFISTYANSLQHFIFAHFLLTESYGKCALRQKPAIASFIERFKTGAMRKSYWQTLSVLMPIYFSISFLLTLCWQKAVESALYDRSRSLLLS